MSTVKCVTVIAGTLNDEIFGHICFVAENLATILPNFQFKKICKSLPEWKSWLKDICKLHGWSHTKSPLVWREIGITGTNITYIGGAYQFWELLHNYYNLSSHLTKEEIGALQSDLLFAHHVESKVEPLEITGVRHVTIIGAGTTLCPDLVAELTMTKELWMSHGLIVNLYDQPGCFFKIRRIIRDVKGIGGGLHVARMITSIPDGLHNCDILIYLDALSREEFEQSTNWLHRNYECIEKLSKLINEHAPPSMKVIFCSRGPTCFYANALHALVPKIPKSNIVAISAHYGLELTYSFASILGLNLRGFGCPPVWGYLGINQFVDMYHTIEKCDCYRPNERAITNKNTPLPLGVKRSELRWFMYLAYDQNPYKYHYHRKAVTQYQVGRTDDLQKCRAICDLLKLWYSAKDEVTDAIISLGIFSDGTFGIPKELVFSQPVYLKVLPDNSRIWVPCADFPMPNIHPSLFQNLIDTAIIIKNKIIKPEK